MILLSQSKNETSLVNLLSTLAPVFNQNFANGILRGIEKENLRVDQQAHLSQQPHPIVLGKALTNESITLDFSDALIEMITPPLQGYAALNNYLITLNRFVVDHISPELLWPFSMPPKIDNQLQVSIADFGQSDIARMKTIYRIGLWHRYGRIMQAIAGIHYNLSFPDELFKALQQQWQKADLSFNQFRSYAYMKLIRNFYRYAWVLPYLFGASPICFSTSVGDKADYLQTYDDESQYAPYGTSLRMSDLGYQNNAQNDLVVDLNSVAGYSKSLFAATHTESNYFNHISVKKDDEYQQLNQNILQIENEYYSFIRPKAKPVSGEPPSISLCRNGIDYIEVRLLDLNPLLPQGIDKNTQQFLDVFLLYCLLSEDYVADENSVKQARKNFQRICTYGRKPKLKLTDDADFVTEATLVLQQVNLVAEALDAELNTDDYQSTVKQQQTKINNAELTPSAKILTTIKQNKLTYKQFCMQQIEANTDTLLQQSYDAKVYQTIAENVKTSISTWQQREQLPQDFDAYLKNYMSKQHQC